MALIHNRITYYPSFIVKLLVKAYMMYQKDRSPTENDAILEARDYLTAGFNEIKIRRTEDEQHFNAFLDHYFPKPLLIKEVEPAIGQVWDYKGVTCVITDIHKSTATDKPINILYKYTRHGIEDISNCTYGYWHKQFRFVSNKEGSI